MNYEVLREITDKRRSVRKFSDIPVSRENIEKIVEIGMRAPSAFNAQPWEIMVVDDRALRDEIADCLIEGIGEARTAKGFREAPVFMMIYGDERTRAYGPAGKRESDEWWRFSLNASLTNAFMSMQLAAASLDLGSMWVSAYRNPEVEGKVRKLLGIPEEMRVFEMMALGYPDIKIGKKKLRELSTVVHYNGESRYRTEEDLREWF